MGQTLRVRTAALAVVENMEPRTLMSAAGTSLGDDHTTGEYEVYAAGGGIVSYVFQGGGGTAVTVNQFVVTPVGDDPATTDVVESGTTLVQRGSLLAATLPNTASFQSIDTNASGQTVVVWNEKVSTNYTIKARTISPSGALGSTVTVASGKADWAGGVGVAIDDAGNYSVVFATEAGGGPFGGTDTDVKLQRVAASGSKLGKVVAVGKTTGTNIARLLTSIDGASTGEVVVAWSSGGTGGAVSVQRYTAAGAKSGSAIVVNRPDRTAELVEGVDMTPDGSRFILTVDARATAGGVDTGDGDFVRIFTGAGAVVGTVDVAEGAASAISPDGTFATTYNTYSQVQHADVNDVDGDGNDTEAYKTEEFRNVMVQEYSADGGLAGAPTTALSSARTYETIDATTTVVSGDSYRTAHIVSLGGSYLVASQYDDNNVYRVDDEARGIIV